MSYIRDRWPVRLPRHARRPPDPGALLKPMLETSPGGTAVHAAAAGLRRGGRARRPRAGAAAGARGRPSLEIVVLLREKAASTTELAEKLDLPKSTVGHHVKVLEQRRADPGRPHAQGARASPSATTAAPHGSSCSRAGGGRRRRPRCRSGIPPPRRRGDAPPRRRRTDAFAVLRVRLEDRMRAASRSGSRS